MRKSVLAIAATLILALEVGPAHAAPLSPQVIDHITAGPDGGWDYATFDSLNQKIYVARTSGVTVIDLAHQTSTAILPDLSRNHIALPINGGKGLLVTVGSTGEAVLVDIAGGTVTGRVKTGAKPDAALVEPQSGLVWVMDNRGGGITLIDPRSGHMEGKIAVEGDLEFAVTDGAGTVYVNVEDRNEIVVLDTKSRSIRAHYALSGCDGPTGLALDTQHRRLIAACANRVAPIVSLRTGKVLTNLPIGNGPDAVVYDPKTDRAFVPNGRDGTLSVIDAGAMKVLATIPTAVSARTATLDPQTGYLYLPSANLYRAPSLC
jgi:DNA-binding beta-propeller fold protein YncE